MIQLQKFNDILQQEVSRKEFLRYMGAALLGIIGVTHVLNNLQKSLSPRKLGTKSKASGYGVTPYGR